MFSNSYALIIPVAPTYICINFLCTYINRKKEFLDLQISIFNNEYVSVNDELYEPIEIHSFSHTFEMFLQPDVVTWHEYFHSINL